MKTFQPPSSPPSDEEMNLLDYPPLTKRQCVRYLPQETPEACQQCEEVAREMRVPVIGGGSLCKRCADFGIYYVRETERGMMAADSELTKQLSSHTLLKNSIKFK